MLPIFPNFKKLELTDCTLIENLVDKFPPYNDFEFMSLWTYNTDGNNMVSMLNGNLVIKIQDFVSGDFFYSFIGKTNTKGTIAELIKKSKEEKLGNKLYLIPEVNLSEIDDLRNNFSIEEDPDSFDYILSVNEIADLSGSKYHDKRNLVNRFKREYPDHEVKPLDLNNKSVQQEVTNLCYLWEHQKGHAREDTVIEFTAIEKLFDLIKILNVLGIGVYNKNKLIGFSTFHCIKDNFAILSFEKSDTSHIGIYEYLNHETAKYLKSVNCEFINYEQDLGIPGLKKAKQLWRPVYFLKKYIVGEL